MAIHFHNGNDHKNYLPVPTEIHTKAVAAAKTYDWIEEAVEDIPEPETTEDKNKEEAKPKPEYPKKFKCQKTGLIASRQSPNSPVMFVKGELLTLTSDEQTVKDIIE